MSGTELNKTQLVSCRAGVRPANQRVSVSRKSTRAAVPKEMLDDDEKKRDADSSAAMQCKGTRRMSWMKKQRRPSFDAVLMGWSRHKQAFEKEKGPAGTNGEVHVRHEYVHQ